MGSLASANDSFPIRPRILSRIHLPHLVKESSDGNRATIGAIAQGRAQGFVTPSSETSLLMTTVNTLFDQISCLLRPLSEREQLVRRGILIIPRSRSRDIRAYSRKPGWGSL